MTDNAIKEILFDYEIDIWRDKRRFMSLLSDYMPSEADKAYRNLIGISVDENIPEEIKYDDKNSIYRCKQRLCNASGCSEEKALEIVDMWAEALKAEQDFLYTLYGGENYDHWESICDDIGALKLEDKLFRLLKRKGIDYIREVCVLTEEDVNSLVGENNTLKIKDALREKGYHLFKNRKDYISKYPSKIWELIEIQPSGWESQLFLDIMVCNLTQLNCYRGTVIKDYTYGRLFGQREKEYIQTNNKDAIRGLFEFYTSAFSQIKEVITKNSIKKVINTHDPYKIISMAEGFIKPYKTTVALYSGFYELSYEDYKASYYYRYIEPKKMPFQRYTKEYNEWFNELSDDDLYEFLSLSEQLTSLRNETIKNENVSNEIIGDKLCQILEEFETHLEKIHQKCEDELSEWFDLDNYSSVEKKKYGIRQCIKKINKELKKQNREIARWETEKERYEIIWDYIKDLPIPIGSDTELSRKLGIVPYLLKHADEKVKMESAIAAKMKQELGRLNNNLEEQ